MLKNDIDEVGKVMDWFCLYFLKISGLIDRCYKMILIWWVRLWRLWLGVNWEGCKVGLEYVSLLRKIRVIFEELNIRLLGKNLGNGKYYKEWLCWLLI